MPKGRVCYPSVTKLVDIVSCRLITMRGTDAEKANGWELFTL